MTARVKQLLILIFAPLGAAIVWALIRGQADSDHVPGPSSNDFIPLVGALWLLFTIALLAGVVITKMGQRYRWMNDASLGVTMGILLVFHDAVGPGSAPWHLVGMIAQVVLFTLLLVALAPLVRRLLSGVAAK